MVQRPFDGPIPVKFDPPHEDAVTLRVLQGAIDVRDLDVPLATATASHGGRAVAFERADGGLRLERSVTVVPERPLELHA